MFRTPLLERLEGTKAKILLLGAHCDDIEIGCGGTILQLLELAPSVEVHWIVFSSNKIRYKEAEASAQHFLSSAKNRTIRILNFRNSFFPAEATEIKEYFESIKQSFNPDLIFTHYRKDYHQDHRVINELTWNTFRDHFILEYEIPKYDGDIGQPTTYMPIANAQRRNKVDSIVKYFESQASRQWFTPSTFDALMRIRGIECNAEDGYAEAFYARKILLG